MTIRLQCINFSARPELQQFVQQRVRKLSLFHDQIIDGEVHLKLENYAEKKNKVAEIKLKIPGNELVVKKRSDSFEESTDLGTEALRRLLNRKKERQRGR